MREHENEMEKHTGYKIKIVERSGRSLKRILTKSNPLGGEDCGREGCLLCQTKAATGMNLNQSCTKRSIVYETWCALCLKKKEETNGQEGGIYKYIGETAKSAFELGANHSYDRKNLDLGSHMLKHSIEHHEGADPEDVTFHMKVLKYHKSSFERQIDEAVKIQHNRQHNILNSKSEYNRSSIPRLGVKMGFKNFKTRHEHDDEARSDEDKKIEEKIRLLRKQTGKKAQRRKCEDESAAPKRRKTEEEFKCMWMTSKDGQEDGDKRKMDAKMPSKDDQPATKVRKTTQMVMDKYMCPGQIADEGAVSMGGPCHHDIGGRPLNK